MNVTLYPGRPAKLAMSKPGVELLIISVSFKIKTESLTDINRVFITLSNSLTTDKNKKHNC